MPTPPIQSRLPQVGTTIFTVMSQLALEHRAINLSQGFPDFEPPERLRELVTHHLNAGHNQYAPMAGVPALREVIAALVREHYGRSIAALDEVTVTSGATEALTCAIQAVVGPGDAVVVFEPTYDSYEPIISLVGGQVRRVPLARPGFGIDWNRLREALHPAPRLVIVNTPHNPAGALLTAADLDRLAALLRDTPTLLLADEVYEHMVYDGARFASFHTQAELAERTFVVSSFGKTLHATGWKVGYCVAPRPLTQEFRKVHQFVTFATASPLQFAIADFLTEQPEFPRHIAAFYQQRRDHFIDLLAGSRWRITPARGTYFQLLDYTALSDLPDTAFARLLLERHGVASIPISPFCTTTPPGERLLRFCFAKQDATLVAAVERLRGL
jgi:methionine aminotransferase